MAIDDKDPVLVNSGTKPYGGTGTHFAISASIVEQSEDNATMISLFAAVKPLARAAQPSLQRVPPA